MLNPETEKDLNGLVMKIMGDHHALRYKRIAPGLWVEVLSDHPWIYYLYYLEPVGFDVEPAIRIATDETARPIRFRSQYAALAWAFEHGPSYEGSAALLESLMTPPPEEREEGEGVLD